jgi:hypothetical protein
MEAKKMKTLRSFRNTAALFILAMALLSSRSGVGVAHAANGKSCGYKHGFSFCSIDASGNCTDYRCAPKGIFGCGNYGCV